MAKKIAEAFILLKAQGARQVGSVLGGLRGLGSNLIDTFARLGLAIDGLRRIGSGLVSIVSTPIKLAAEAEQIEVAMETMIGSADRAKSVLAELYDLGAETPFEFTDLAKASRTLLSFGANVDDVVTDVEMLSNIASGDANKLQSLALVFGQIQSTGRLMGQDLLQLINQGFNPLQQIAERTGESMTALKKRMEQGQISFDEVKQAFVDATSEGGRFYQMNEKQSKTLMGVWSTLQDNIGQAMIKIGKAIAEGLNLKGLTEGFSAWIGEMAELFDILSTDWGEAWEIMKLYVFGVIQQIGAYIVEIFSNTWEKITTGFKLAWETAKLALNADKILEDSVARQNLLAQVQGEFRGAEENWVRQLMERRPELGLTEKDMGQFMRANMRGEMTGRIWDMILGESQDGVQLPQEEIERFQEMQRAAMKETQALMDGHIDQFAELRRARLEASQAWSIDQDAIDAAGSQFFGEAKDRLDRLRRRRDAERAATAATPEAAAAEGPLGMGMMGSFMAMGTQIGVAMTQVTAKMLDKLPRVMTTSMTDITSVNRAIQESMERRRIDLQKLQTELTKSMDATLKDILDVQRRGTPGAASFG